MRVLTIFFAFMLVLPVGIILSAEQASAMPSPRIWTFMVYGAGDNDLEKELIQDINEMELIGTTDEVTFEGYANRSYDILVRYITNGTGKNFVIIEVEFNGILEIKNIDLDASEGAIQEMYIYIDDDLNETLCELNGTIFTKTNATLNMEPNNLIEENDIFDWENIEWDFGDGTSLTTTNRTVTHEYETPGTYIVTITVTYDDETTVTVTKEVLVS
jgi:hypothetical protein